MVGKALRCAFGEIGRVDRALPTLRRWRCSYSHLKQHKRHRPLTWFGRWGLPVFRSLFPSPESRGMARREGAPVTRVVRLAPDLLRRTGRSMRPAPLGAPCAASSAIGLLRVSDRGRLALVRPLGW